MGFVGLAQGLGSLLVEKFLQTQGELYEQKARRRQAAGWATGAALIGRGAGELLAGICWGAQGCGTPNLLFAAVESYVCFREPLLIAHLEGRMIQPWQQARLWLRWHPSSFWILRLGVSIASNVKT